MADDPLKNPLPPDPDRDEDWEDDEEERDNQQLEPKGLSKLLAAPFYVMLLIVWLGIACVPILILITVAWMTRQAAAMN
jgi:hypothetical protein